MLFKNKYRIESARLKGWDYRRTGAYFITTCTKNKKRYFGNVINDKMILSNLGLAVEKELLKSVKFKSYAELDEYIIMPNHIHVIIMIYNDKLEKKIFFDEINHKPEGNDLKTNLIKKDSNPVLSKINFKKAGSVSSIIGQFKSECTKKIRAAGYKEFGWQTRFHDHIIRTEKGLNRIRNIFKIIL